MSGKKTLSFIVVFAFAIMARPAHAQIQLTINSGRVSLSAKNATAAQILAEWARVGQTRIVNAERVGGGPMTLELTNVSEIEAIETLLRSAGGYLLAPRRTEIATASKFDRILILPQSSPVVSTPARVAATQPPAPVARPFAPPQPGQIVTQQPNDDSDDVADRPAVATPTPQPPRPPVFNTFPQAPQRTAPPPATAAPTSSVTVPTGVAVPGMVVPTPQPAGSQPGVVTPPQQPQR